MVVNQSSGSRGLGTLEAGVSVHFCPRDGSIGGRPARPPAASSDFPLDRRDLSGVSPPRARWLIGAGRLLRGGGVLDHRQTPAGQHEDMDLLDSGNFASTDALSEQPAGAQATAPGAKVSAAECGRSLMVQRSRTPPTHRPDNRRRQHVVRRRAGR